MFSSMVGKITLPEDICRLLAVCLSTLMIKRKPPICTFSCVIYIACEITKNNDEMVFNQIKITGNL